jgi:hypothetical protein
MRELRRSRGLVFDNANSGTATGATKARETQNPGGTRDRESDKIAEAQSGRRPALFRAGEGPSIRPLQIADAVGRPREIHLARVVPARIGRAERSPRRGAGERPRLGKTSTC